MVVISRWNRVEMLKVLRQKQKVPSHPLEWQDAFCSVRKGEHPPKWQDAFCRVRKGEFRLPPRTDKTLFAASQRGELRVTSKSRDISLVLLNVDR